MKARIAVATVSGKAYYLIVNELKKKNLPFLSLTPNEPVPLEIYVVISTEEESSLIKHENVLAYKDEMEPELLINKAVQIIQGKKRYEKIVIGVDPGEVLGLAVLADGKVIETGNCFSTEETSRRIASILKRFKSSPTASVSVKIGDGVPKYREKLLWVLDEALPSNVVLESVSEAGTNLYASETKHRRGLRDIVSAIKIAGRNGHRFSRRKKTDEPHS
jgi:ABC-type sugar transport system ATPase subunit